MLWFTKASILLLTLLSFALAQTSISTVITPEQRATLEQLVVIAEENSLEVQQAELSFTLAKQKLEPLGRLKEALNITGSTTLSGDYYNQVSLSYSISLSLNVLNLFPDDQTKQEQVRLDEARTTVRLEVVENYLSYIAALEQAKARAFIGHQQNFVCEICANLSELTVFKTFHPTLSVSYSLFKRYFSTHANSGK